MCKGEADYFVPEELIDQTVAGIPSGLGEKLVAKKVDHYLIFEQPEYCARVVMDFLKRRNVVA